MIGLLLAALLALPAAAQEQGQWQTDCFGGLNDGVTAAALPNCDSPALLNVEPNLDASAIMKRKGFAKFADMTIATSPITGSYSFIDSNGSRLDIVCQDTMCSKSTNGNAFVTFLTTAAAGVTSWSFVDQGGVLYGANNRYDKIMKYDGTTRSSPVGMPLGSILELTQDRLAIGDISGSPNRVHYSSAGAYEQFTVGVNPEDSFFDDIGTDGDKVRGIKCIQGNCFIFKTQSITLCEMADQYNTQCSVVSPNIGTTDPASIVAAGSDLFFRAQDKSYWKIGRNGLEQISKKIPNFVKSQSGGLGGGENTNTQTSQTDWNNGVQYPTGTFNTASTNGSIFPSSATLADDTTTEWGLGVLKANLDLTQAGYLRLSSTTVQDSWNNGLVTGRLAWVDASAGTGWDASTLRLRAIDTGAELGEIINTSSVTYSTGSWKMTYNQAGAQSCSISLVCWQMRFMVTSGGDYYALQWEDGRNSGDFHNLVLLKNVSSVETRLTSYETTITLGSDYTFEVQRSTDGRLYALMSGVFVSSTPADTSVASSAKFELRSSAPSGRTMLYDDFYFYNYKTSATFISQTFDTYYSTPTWGPLSSTFTTPDTTGGQVNFYTQASADNATWDARVASSDTLRMASAQKRYGRYVIEMQTAVSTKTPSVSAISITAETTGTFRTQCIQTNASISAWGVLSCAETKSGLGSLVYYATGAYNCGLLPSGNPTTWQTSVTNNATLPITVSSAVYIGWRSLGGSTTDQAQVDACVLAWTEGTPSQPAWGVYDSIKHSVYWTTTINGAVAANRLLQYRLDLQQWYPWDIPAQAPRFINNSLYFGGASSGTWNLFGGVDSDAGYAINSYWTSRDIGSDQPFREKDFQKLSILSKNQGTGSMTGTYTYSNAQTGSYTISLSTGTGITYARSNFNLPLASPHEFVNVKVGNFSSTPWEVLGLGVTWAVRPWRVSGP